MTKKPSWVAIWTGASGRIVLSGAQGTHYETLKECRDRNSGADVYARIEMVAGRLFIHEQTR